MILHTLVSMSVEKRIWHISKI